MTADLAPKLFTVDTGSFLAIVVTGAVAGWAMSLAIAYGLGGALALAGVVVSLVYVGSALATTAIGTLLPVLSDTGELNTEFGTYLLAAGAVGEFGPVLLLTLVLSTQSAVHNAIILIAFVALAVAVAVAAVGLPAAHCPSSSERSNTARSSRCDGSWCSCSRSCCSW